MTKVRLGPRFKKYFICNVNARLSKRFIIRAGHVSVYMFGNIEYNLFVKAVDLL
jgi:hypothetical protein